MLKQIPILHKLFLQIPRYRKRRSSYLIRVKSIKFSIIPFDFRNFETYSWQRCFEGHAIPNVISKSRDGKHRCLVRSGQLWRFIRVSLACSPRATDPRCGRVVQGIDNGTVSSPIQVLPALVINRSRVFRR